ncbi:MAG: UDP-N-acetylmuramoyl-L-alanyl-D-glutamate--2,6-diaminopimelate ligase [Pseudomonadota bacterium]
MRRLSDLAGEACARDPMIAGLTADSREVGKNFLFAALPGEVHDGARFIPQAEEKGASAILAPPGVTARAPVIHDAEPRRRFAAMAARFYERQPEIVTGITGTNGKTSTALFAAQLWELAGRTSASLGTLGARGRGGEDFGAPDLYTTPEPVALHKALRAMSDAGVTRLAMEVSSHGLAQFRADGVRFKAAAFANITRDHLDFHKDFDAYENAKARLFTALLEEDGCAVINMDGEGAEKMLSRVMARGLRRLTTGAKGSDIRLASARPTETGTALQVVCDGRTLDIALPLIGEFQAENALLAAGLVVACGEGAADAVAALEKLRPAPGRMERVADLRGGAIYVDYAHTPDAIASALAALRPHLAGRLIAIIGAGGDRDREKRPLMGAAAAAGADAVIVTDDNPRTEDRAAIRAAVMKGAPDAQEIGDRGAAIAAGAAMLNKGDILLIAGKGHETGQMVGSTKLPFNDAEVARAAAAAAGD